MVPVHVASRKLRRALACGFGPTQQQHFTLIFLVDDEAYLDKLEVLQDGRVRPKAPSELFGLIYYATFIILKILNGNFYHSIGPPTLQDVSNVERVVDPVEEPIVVKAELPASPTAGLSTKEEEEKIIREVLKKEVASCGPRPGMVSYNEH